MAKINSGFSLIELLVTIAIIGVLSSIVIFSSQAYMQRARDAQRKTDLQSIRGALETYRADNGSYPAGVSPNYQINGCGGLCTWGSAWINSGSTYMSKLPQDPKGSSTNYRYSSAGTTYILEACLENSAESLSTSVVNPGTNWSTGCTSNRVYQVTQP